MSVFDTNIIIDFLRGKQEAKNIIEKYKDKGVSITSITGYELIKGLKPKEKPVLDALFNEVVVHPFNFKAMMIAGETYKKLKSKGSTLSDADLIIFSIAAANQELFITQDKAFERLENENVIVVSIQ
ncbi:MAG: type II toxin-antitoxin system VapC family toxin [Candidatus Marsarchaeota archaeon]|nr:type II toxin-antitoxin system VapC family toxin [Candidatus Marsarchaeota archaeon]